MSLYFCFLICDRSAHLYFHVLISSCAPFQVSLTLQHSAFRLWPRWLTRKIKAGGVDNGNDDVQQAESQSESEDERASDGHCALQTSVCIFYFFTFFTFK